MSIQEDIVGTALNATHHNLEVNAIIKSVLSNYNVEMVSDSKQSYVTQLVSDTYATQVPQQPPYQSYVQCINPSDTIHNKYEVLLDA